MAKLTIANISIENLGPFRERQTLDLGVQPSRPVVLIKALNGSGKTTLLTALQIALYGYKAINLTRRSEYDQLIADLQRKDAIGNATIEVTLTIEIGAARETVVVRREWAPRGASLLEKLSVLRDGTVDMEFSETWDEFINGILPAELMQLFLFDGEKIEALANPDRLPSLLRHATEVFLGLGGIDALANDLRAVERRAGTNKKGATEVFDEIRVQAIAFETQLEEINNRIAILTQNQASAICALDEAQRNLEKFTLEAKRNGSDAYQQAAELRSHAKFAEDQYTQARSALVETLQDPILPLTWLRPLWKHYGEQWDKDRQAHNVALLAEEFAKRDQRILQALANSAPQSDHSVAELLTHDLVQFLSSNQHPPVLLPGAEPIEIQPRLEWAIARAKNSVREVEEAAYVLQKAQQSASKIPAEEQLSGIFTELRTRTKAASTAEMLLHDLASEIAKARSTQAHIEARLNASLQRMRAEFKEEALEQKSLEAAARARKALSVFRERLLASKAQWLSAMITAEFKQLLRKLNLISRVLVDPTSYSVSIEDANGHTLPMERLSAGERQILAISVLSALIRERRGHFPVVVDTPLARLDRKHRNALIRNFFANVSHQVLVLSTDEEVEGAVYDALQHHMNHEYTLTFDDASRRSVATMQRPQILAVAMP